MRKKNDLTASISKMEAVTTRESHFQEESITSAHN